MAKTTEETRTRPVKRKVKRRPAARPMRTRAHPTGAKPASKSKPQPPRPRFPNLEESSDLAIVKQADLDQLNLEFMETLGAQLFGTLFPNGLKLNHQHEQWPDIVITVKNDTVTLDARNIPPSFKLPGEKTDRERHELLSTWRLRLQMEGQTVIEFGKGVHGVYFDKSKATRVMLKNMLSRFLPGLKK